MTGQKFVCLCLLLAGFPVLLAQSLYQPFTLTAEDYRRAELTLAQHTNGKIPGDRVQPVWLSDQKFAYHRTTGKGTEFVMVDVIRKTKTPAFDHQALAEALSTFSGKSYQSHALPFRSFTLDEVTQVLTFEVNGATIHYDIKTKSCTAGGNNLPFTQAISPDKKKAVYIREHNLWLKDLESGSEQALTKDGIPDFGYATNNAGWIQSPRPVVLWSPDSKLIATFQHDGRGVGEMNLASTKVGHPDIKIWKYPLPGDSLIFRIERVVIRVDDNQVIRLHMPPDQHRSSFTDHIANDDGSLGDCYWSADSRQLVFLSNSRDHKEATLRLADPVTGKVEDILHEREETFFESGFTENNWRFLSSTNQILWYSQRSNWGHLYLYDLKTKKPLHQVTKGDWNVLQVLRADEKARVIYFTGVGREPGHPYYVYLYRVNFDGSGLSVLTPGEANHAVDIGPDSRFLVDVSSTPNQGPVSILRDIGGQEIMRLEQADLSELKNEGNWQAPEPIKVKARDGATDLYGLMFKPINFDPTKKYPIINYIYPGPQIGSVGSFAFSASRGDQQALANLGFIVVAINAMGTPFRSKSFHTAYYGNMGDNGLPDQISAMQQLAARHPWIDLDRAGIYGGSGGGFASTDAILRYPDFFKVAVSWAGNHDNRNYEDDWGEKYHGLLHKNADGSTNYDDQANQNLAANLKGKLLLMHGTLDDNVPYYNTLLVADRLIAANKDFDLLLFPNRRHGGGEAYVLRKRWDYFVKHLLRAEPPKEYQFNLGGLRP